MGPNAASQRATSLVLDTAAAWLSGGRLFTDGWAGSTLKSPAPSCMLQRGRPDLVILNPLVLCSGGVELELIETLQQDDDPVPLILIVDDLEALAAARQMRIAFRDFLLKPVSAVSEFAIYYSSSRARLHNASYDFELRGQPEPQGAWWVARKQR